MAKPNKKSTPAKINRTNEIPEEDNNGFSAYKKPELFIGLIGPLGSDLELVTKSLISAFDSVGYNSEIIRISDGLKEIDVGVDLEDIDNDPEDTRLEKLIKAGTQFRTQMERGDALALMAALKVRERREKLTGHTKKPSLGTVYILRSLKHKQEVETLRNIYGRAFFLISAYSPREDRKERLAKKIADSRNDSSNIEKYYSAAEALITTDLNEEQTRLGQDVTNAFPLADLFIDVESEAKVRKGIQRFTELVFDHPFRTPTRDEFGMFQAQAAALRSADLSRQVGAAIMTKEGDIISLGCNEVPKAGGGFHWSDEDERKDFRDYAIGYDSNAYMKRLMLEELITELHECELIPKKRSDLKPEIIAKLAAKKIINLNEHEWNAREIAAALLYGKDSPIKDAQLLSILEFGRIVHAEMAAITDAARRGLKISGGTLYCTTFPCHMCARHIVAAGIDRVVFIEPYPKSKAAPLHKDSIEVDKLEGKKSLVSFQSFVGIAPRGYMDFFTMPSERKNKKTGDKKPWVAKEATPKLKRFVSSYIAIELQAVTLFQQKLTEIAAKKTSASISNIGVAKQS